MAAKPGNQEDRSFIFKDFSDSELLDLLRVRIQHLESRMQRMQNKFKELNLHKRLVAFCSSIFLVLVVFFLTIAPYLGRINIDIPDIISYTAAFANLFAIYLAIKTYKLFNSSKSLQEKLKIVLLDAELSLNNAYKLIKTIEEGAGK